MPNISTIFAKLVRFPQLSPLLENIVLEEGQMNQETVQRYRNELLAILNDEENIHEKSKNPYFFLTVHEALLALAEQSPINDDSDLASGKKIPNNLKIYVSSGHQFKIDDITKFHDKRKNKYTNEQPSLPWCKHPPRYLLNPYTNLPFHWRDAVHIEKTTKSIGIQIQSRIIQIPINPSVKTDFDSIFSGILTFEQYQALPDYTKEKIFSDIEITKSLFRDLNVSFVFLKSLEQSEIAVLYFFYKIIYSLVKERELITLKEFVEKSNLREEIINNYLEIIQLVVRRKLVTFTDLFQLSEDNRKELYDNYNKIISLASDYEVIAGATDLFVLCRDCRQRLYVEVDKKSSRETVWKIITEGLQKNQKTRNARAANTKDKTPPVIVIDEPTSTNDEVQSSEAQPGPSKRPLEHIGDSVISEAPQKKQKCSNSQSSCVDASFWQNMPPSEGGVKECPTSLWPENAPGVS